MLKLIHWVAFIICPSVETGWFQSQSITSQKTVSNQNYNKERQNKGLELPSKTPDPQSKLYSSYKFVTKISFIQIM